VREVAGLTLVLLPAWLPLGALLWTSLLLPLSGPWHVSLRKAAWTSVIGILGSIAVLFIAAIPLRGPGAHQLTPIMLGLLGICGSLLWAFAVNVAALQKTMGAVVRVGHEHWMANDGRYARVTELRGGIVLLESEEGISAQPYLECTNHLGRMGYVRDT
jgi:hypothetical protein